MGKRIHGKHDCKVGELMTFMDICAGIGGFRAGMEQAGNAVTVNVIKAIGERMNL